MAGTQGSSYGSSGAAAAGNRQVTSNLRSGLNASGSSRTNSGYGNTSARSSVNAAAANAARMAAERATSSASQRTATSQGGYGPSRPASANVNAAAARASMMNNQRSAGITQSAPGRGDAFGANQTVSRGVNQSAADYMAQGYGAYKNPNATQSIQNGFGSKIASLAAPKQNIQTVNKGINQSAADLLAAGYGKYQSPPSMQSTPVAAQNGWNALGGLQQAVSKMNPNLGQIVAGDPLSSFKPVSSAGEIGSLVRPMLGGADYGAQMAQAALSNFAPSVPKDLSRIAQAPDIPVTESYWANKQQLPGNAYASIQGGPQAPSINDVPSLPNYAPPVSVAAREPRPYDSPTQQTASLLSPMAGQGATFRNPTSAKQYNAAMGGLLSAQNNPPASAQPARGNDPLVASNDLYDGESTLQQKINGSLETRFEKIASPAQKIGDKINGLLGGSGYNDLYGNKSQGNQNARDALNSEAEKSRHVQNEAQIASKSPEFRSLSAADQKTVMAYIEQGLTLAEAIAKLKSGSATAQNTAIPRPTVRYPEYYSKWANLPTGAYA